LATFTALSQIRCRISGDSAGEGDSSISFWWRRWIEQSRSYRWDDVAVAIGEDLHLDVARVLDELLEVHRAVPERGFGLRARGVESGDEARLVARDAHPAPAASRGGLDHHREADRVRDRERLLLVLDGSVGAGHDGHAGLLRDLARLHLVAEHRDRLGLGSDELDLARPADLGEVVVLREEPVARVDRLDVRDFRGGDDRRDVEVGLRRGGRPDADRVVRLREVERVRVGGAVDRDRLDAELTAGHGSPAARSRRGSR
jgi:hypothetical protein